jgi:hypothetical protein
LSRPSRAMDWPCRAKGGPGRCQNAWGRADARTPRALFLPTTLRHVFLVRHHCSTAAATAIDSSMPIDEECPPQAWSCPEPPARYIGPSGPKPIPQDCSTPRLGLVPTLPRDPLPFRAKGGLTSGSPANARTPRALFLPTDLHHPLPVRQNARCNSDRILGADLPRSPASSFPDLPERCIGPAGPKGDLHLAGSHLTSNADSAH